MSSDLGNNDVVLRAQGISKHFPGVKALHNVDFSLRKGEIVALLGENGAGKSTLVKTLTGVYQRDAGDIFLNGQSISPQNTAHAQQLGIGTVYQEVNLLPNMSVMDNLFIGNEPKKWGFVDRKRMAQQATEIMTGYGLHLDVTQPLNSFSVAIQQVISIARAVSLSANILILDEPTASLDSSEVEMLFGIMRDLRAKGISLVFITHFLDQVYEVSDRITVLRNGELVGTRETSQLPQIELVKWMLGRELEGNALKRAGKPNSVMNLSSSFLIMVSVVRLNHLTSKSMLVKSWVLLAYLAPAAPRLPRLFSVSRRMIVAPVS